MDIHFLETARLMALHGADVICHISNWPAERTPAPYWISRAFENGCYVVESNPEDSSAKMVDLDPS